MDKIDRNLKKSEYIVKGMTSTFGFIKNLFTGTKKLDKKREEVKEEPIPSNEFQMQEPAFNPQVIQLNN